MEPIYVKAGDTFFTRSESWLGKAIRWAEAEQNDPNSWANHTGVVVQDGEIRGANTAVVIEALWKTRKGPLLGLNGTAVRVFRPVPPYSPEELARFKAEAETYVGDTYGWWKLGFHLLDRLFFKGKKVLTHLLFVKKRPICSFLAAYVNEAARSGEHFGIDPETADPDSMMDYCLANPQLWEEVK